MENGHHFVRWMDGSPRVAKLIHLPRLKVISNVVLIILIGVSSIYFCAAVGQTVDSLLTQGTK